LIEQKEVTCPDTARKSPVRETGLYRVSDFQNGGETLEVTHTIDT
jgi:hypothetical protein